MSTRKEVTLTGLELCEKLLSGKDVYAHATGNMRLTATPERRLVLVHDNGLVDRECPVLREGIYHLELPWYETLSERKRLVRYTNGTVYVADSYSDGRVYINGSGARLSLNSVTPLTDDEVREFLPK